MLVRGTRFTLLVGLRLEICGWSLPLKLTPLLSAVLFIPLTVVDGNRASGDCELL